MAGNNKNRETEMLADIVEKSLVIHDENYK